MAQTAWGYARCSTDRQDQSIKDQKKEITGAEVDVQWQPAEGLYLAFSASYVDTEVSGDFIASDIAARDINYGGSKFPDTAELQMTALVNYEWSINSELNGFVGFDLSYTDAENIAAAEMVVDLDRREGAPTAVEGEPEHAGDEPR